MKNPGYIVMAVMILILLSILVVSVCQRQPLRTVTLYDANGSPVETYHRVSRISTSGNGLSFSDSAGNRVIVFGTISVR